MSFFRLLIARLHGCHQNGLEAFSYFAAAVALCVASGVEEAKIDRLANIFLAQRVIYSYVYATGTQKWKGYARFGLFLTSFSTAFHMLNRAAAAYKLKKARR